MAAMTQFAQKRPSRKRLQTLSGPASTSDAIRDCVGVSCVLARKISLKC